MSELRGNVIGSKNVGIRWSFSDWAASAEIGFEIANDTREFDGAGALVSRVLIRNVRPIEAQEFATLVAMPSIGGADPIRGSIGDRVVKDSRAGEPTYTTYKDGSPVKTIAKAELPAEKSRQRLIVIGWIVGSALLVGFVALAIQRRGGGRHT